MNKIRTIHLTARNYREVVIDRRSENLRDGKLRKYEHLSNRQINRIMKVLQARPLCIGLYQNGFTCVWVDNDTDKHDLTFWGN